VFEFVCFYVRVERNLLKINKKYSTVFEKKKIEKERRKIFFYKLKKSKEKSKRKKIFL